MLIVRRINNFMKMMWYALKFERSLNYNEFYVWDYYFLPDDAIEFREWFWFDFESKPKKPKILYFE